MASQPKKPRARSRRKASAQPSSAAEASAHAVAVADEAPPPDERIGASAAEAKTATSATLDEARAEAMAMALARMAEAEAEAEAAPEEVVDEEERIRSVQELLSLGAGECELLLFRLGREAFAFDLAAAEEAVELESVHAVPDMPDAMLGVFDLRGRLIPVYSPAAMLCTPDTPASGVLLLMRAGDRRVGIVVDDVEDVVVLDHGMWRPPPSADADGLVLGVAFFGDALVTILDAHALVATCAAPAIAEVA